jgi:hypothetical protein
MRRRWLQTRNPALGEILHYPKQSVAHRGDASKDRGDHRWTSSTRVLLLSVRLGVLGRVVSDPAGRSRAGGGLTRVLLVVRCGLTGMGCVAHRRPRTFGVT